jgi:hypothetical protein
VAKREIAVIKDGKNATEQILRVLDQQKKKSYKKGAVLRWAFRASGTQAVILGLQGLPAFLAYIKCKAQFSMDNCPALLLAEVALEMPMSKAGLIEGPPPMLFTPTPDDTMKHIMEDPTAALEGKDMHKTVQKHNELESNKYDGIKFLENNQITINKTDRIMKINIKYIYAGVARAMRKIPYLEQIPLEATEEFLDNPYTTEPGSPFGEVTLPPSTTRKAAKRRREEDIEHSKGRSRRTTQIPKDDVKNHKYSKRTGTGNCTISFEAFKSIFPP